MTRDFPLILIKVTLRHNDWYVCWVLSYLHFLCSGYLFTAHSISERKTKTSGSRLKEVMWKNRNRKNLDSIIFGSNSEFNIC